MNLSFENPFGGIRVLVTGHTGFTGGWLCSWLAEIGAEVTGLSLSPETTPSLFTELKLDDRIESRIGDIRDNVCVDDVVNSVRPHLVMHLAAQPLVSAGYEDPRGTFETNVMGTLNVLEAASRQESVQGVMCVTTDKVYRNNEWIWGYRENDALGGKDPYSASKSAAEMVVSTYRQTLAPMRNKMSISAARGGNIIGGGDWADNRIIPDCIRAALSGKPLVLRNPMSVRPWQHVLELCHGYLLLGAAALRGADEADDDCNFGPAQQGQQTVGKLVDEMKRNWSDFEVEKQVGTFVESNLLSLNSEKARNLLSWSPPLDFEQTVAWTAGWYREFHTGKGSAVELVGTQIQKYRDMTADLSAQAH